MLNVPLNHDGASLEITLIDLPVRSQFHRFKFAAPDAAFLCLLEVLSDLFIWPGSRRFTLSIRGPRFSILALGVNRSMAFVDRLLRLFVEARDLFALINPRWPAFLSFYRCALAPQMGKEFLNHVYD
jgi:hypothetical protein